METQLGLLQELLHFVPTLHRCDLMCTACSYSCVLPSGGGDLLCRRAHIRTRALEAVMHMLACTVHLRISGCLQITGGMLCLISKPSQSERVPCEVSLAIMLAQLDTAKQPRLPCLTHANSLPSRLDRVSCSRQCPVVKVECFCHVLLRRLRR